ncbi:hypothetical protein SALBM311S_03055 [Streptomyces alboniger]
MHPISPASRAGFFVVSAGGGQASMQTASGPIVVLVDSREGAQVATGVVKDGQSVRRRCPRP